MEGEIFQVAFTPSGTERLPENFFPTSKTAFELDSMISHGS